MRDEVRERAERLRAFNEISGPDFYQKVYAIYNCDDTSRINRYLRADAFALAKAYLAEHPADDGEAVTEDWLRSLATKTLMCGKEIDYHRFKFENGFSRLNIYPDCSVSIERNDDEIPLPLQLNTRGDVRLLCRALGIPLKENGEVGK